MYSRENNESLGRRRESQTGFINLTWSQQTQACLSSTCVFVGSKTQNEAAASTQEPLGLDL